MNHRLLLVLGLLGLSGGVGLLAADKGSQQYLTFKRPTGRRRGLEIPHGNAQLPFTGNTMNTIADRVADKVMEKFQRPSYVQIEPSSNWRQLIVGIPIFLSKQLAISVCAATGGLLVHYGYMRIMHFINGPKATDQDDDDKAPLVFRQQQRPPQRNAQVPPQILAQQGAAR